MTKAARNAADSSDYSKVKQSPFQMATIPTHAGELTGKYFFERNLRAAK